MTRRATAADADAIAHVHRCARAEAYGADYAERPLRAGDERWVLEHDGVVIGFLALDGSLLSMLYVLPGAQGSGAGAALLERAMERGARVLWVFTFNTGAQRFYERHGWTQALGSLKTGEDWWPRAPAVRYEHA